MNASRENAETANEHAHYLVGFLWGLEYFGDKQKEKLRFIMQFLDAACVALPSESEIPPPQDTDE